MRILLIDDDPHILEGLKRMLSSISAIKQIDACLSGKAALDLAKTTSGYDLVVCDLQMPQLNGVQVLEQFRTSSPGTIRFVLTGMIDHPLHHAALRLSHQMIAKPCRPEILRELIERALRLKRHLSQSELSSILPRLQALPSLPKTYRRVMDYLVLPTASCRGLSRLISEDIGMSARLMQLANSAYYGKPGKVHNPVQAVVYLGMRTIEALILRQGIFSQIDPALAARFGASALESHCMRVGCLAKRICADLSMPAGLLEQASIAGILHDTGKIIMIAEFTERFEQSLVKSRRDHIELIAAEKQICGFTHAELGASLLSLWSMPADIIEAAAFHHVPWLLAEENAPTKRPLCLADTVYIADCIDHRLCSSRSDGCTFGVLEAYLERYGLNQQFCQWQTDHLSVLKEDLCYA
ncbi:MAG: HDOD domain-containing protein [Planctomycetaceae bacterium]|nr:HDOD domain-containing protein [Planctomycetaceae bacterium]